MNWDWSFEYEQCPLSGGWVYKSDPAAVDDGAWHHLNRDSKALYRVVDGMIQLFEPGDKLTDADVEQCRRWLESAGVLRTEDQLEIVIARHPEGCEMWSHWLDGDDGIVFRDFNPGEFNAAYDRLREAESCQ